MAPGLRPYSECFNFNGMANSAGPTSKRSSLSNRRRHSLPAKPLKTVHFAELTRIWVFDKENNVRVDDDHEVLVKVCNVERLLDQSTQRLKRKSTRATKFTQSKELLERKVEALEERSFLIPYENIAPPSSPAYVRVKQHSLGLQNSFPPQASPNRYLSIPETRWSKPASKIPIYASIYGPPQPSVNYPYPITSRADAMDNQNSPQTLVVGSGMVTPPSKHPTRSRPPPLPLSTSGSRRSYSVEAVPVSCTVAQGSSDRDYARSSTSSSRGKKIRRQSMPLPTLSSRGADEWLRRVDPN